MNLKDKIIVITGASKGLGRETALRLCRRNPNLVLVARTQELLEKTQNKILNITGNKPVVISCDISSEAEVTRMAGIISEKFEHIDVLINNSGIGIHKPAEEISGLEMRRQFEVNFYGSFYCTKALLPMLKSSKSAYILNVASLVSRISFPDNSVYAATKSALSNFSGSLSYEMKKYNIRVGLFFPGLMDTSFQDDREDRINTPAFMFINPEKAAQKLEQMIIKRKKTVYMYRWMLLPMKLKQLFQ
jgi:uncharacterized protein